MKRMSDDLMWFISECATRPCFCRIKGIVAQFHIIDRILKNLNASSNDLKKDVLSKCQVVLLCVNLAIINIIRSTFSVRKRKSAYRLHFSTGGSNFQNISIRPTSRGFYIGEIVTKSAIWLYRRPEIALFVSLSPWA